VSAGFLTLSGLTRRFGQHVAVNGLSLEVRAGELLALIGASGSGKTTTLRMIAGYERADAGTVALDGRDITRLPPQQRGFGMVFQHYALFPHMPVEENVAFGLEARGVTKDERLARARAALGSVGLSGAGARPVQSLSGGEQQRVALARALVIEPHVLLLDEPLSNLDPTLRESTRNDLRAMLHRLGVTAVLVTHDQEDAFAVADRVALLHRGSLQQVGTPEELYDRPASRVVAEFIGRASLVPAVLRAGRVAVAAAGIEQSAAAAPPDGRASAAGSVMAVLRPELLSFAAADDASAWPAVVLARRFAGATSVYRVKLGDGHELEVAASDRVTREGDTVRVKLSRGPVAVVAADGIAP
jgi:ABC-type Fe3+/spermidine/putrescine transport system ATPase subunit